jgi:hypothetical protein
MALRRHPSTVCGRYWDRTSDPSLVSSQRGNDVLRPGIWAVRRPPGERWARNYRITEDRLHDVVPELMEEYHLNSPFGLT